MKKSNKTFAIINEACKPYGYGGSILARMILGDIMSRGLSSKVPSEKLIIKNVESRHADDGRELIDEDGHKYIKASLISADYEKSLLLTEFKIIKAYQDGEIDIADFSACLHEFYK